MDYWLLEQIRRAQINAELERMHAVAQARRAALEAEVQRQHAQRRAQQAALHAFLGAQRQRQNEQQQFQRDILEDLLGLAGVWMHQETTRMPTDAARQHAYAQAYPRDGYRTFRTAGFDQDGWPIFEHRTYRARVHVADEWEFTPTQDGDERRRWAEFEEQTKAEEARRLQQERQAEGQRLRAAWDSYETRWAALPTLPCDIPWSFSTIPWPVSSAPVSPADLTPAAIRRFLLATCDDTNRKERLRAALLRWHPDKFNGKYLHKVSARDRQRVSDGVTAVCHVLQELQAER